jgi:hypothetical protein
MGDRLRWCLALVALLAGLVLPTAAFAAATASTMFQVDPAHDGYV